MIFLSFQWIARLIVSLLMDTFDEVVIFLHKVIIGYILKNAASNLIIVQFFECGFKQKLAEPRCWLTFTFVFDFKMLCSFKAQVTLNFLIWTIGLIVLVFNVEASESSKHSKAAELGAPRLFQSQLIMLLFLFFLHYALISGKFLGLDRV